jgi:hypothetical protein
MYSVAWIITCSNSSPCTRHSSELKISYPSNDWPTGLKLFGPECWKTHKTKTKKTESFNSWQHRMTSRDVTIPVEFSLQKHMRTLHPWKDNYFWHNLSIRHFARENATSTFPQVPINYQVSHGIFARFTMWSTAPVINMENFNIPLVVCQLHQIIVVLLWANIFF